MLNFDSYQLGLYFGRAALMVYMLTLVPGICRRLRVRHRVISLLTLYRRQLGIAMYILALLHAALFVQFTLAIPTFKLFGLLALITLTPLFLTANTYAVRKLKYNWKRLHQLTYVALGFIVLHTALNRWSSFAGAALVTLALLCTSFVVARFATRPHGT
jgi:sulfoxide reductase heme-binding subunit YedZ